MTPPPLPAPNRHSVPRFRPPCAPHQIHKNPDPKNRSSSSSSSPSSASSPFSFVVELRLPSSDPRHRLSLPPLSSILGLSSLPEPQFHEPNPPGSVYAALFYRDFPDALNAVVSLWRHRFKNSIHTVCPSLVSSVLSSSEEDQLHERLKTVFLEQIETLVDGHEVNYMQNKLTQIDDEVHKLDGLLRGRGLLMRVFHELQGKRSGLMDERHAIVKRLMEFYAAMKCIRAYLEGKRVFSEGDEEKGFWVFRFDHGKRVDWIRINQLMCRECRRLEDGLPIYAHREEILTKIHSDQVTVLIGETGSGKSTQLVQYLADSGVAAGGAIVCTQPRKIAALSLAERVKEECAGCSDENSISCLPTFSTSHSIKSKVSYMTDNCLLQHYMHDKSLSGVSCILVDEAHERSLNTDLLLAMLKKLLFRKPSLRLVIMSATADAEQLASYFYGCEILHVVGRSFPVDIKYVPFYGEGSSSSDNVAPYVSEVVKLARKIHEKEKEGTILAFLTSPVEIEWACDNFTRACDNIKASLAAVLPLHGKLTHEEQFRVFNNYAGKRKVIFATNVAETSLTIPGVKYVIDSGLVKESKFEPATGMNVLRVCSISQSSANQRAGRAGRTEPGQCYRLFEESVFMTMAPNQEPEIRRVHLGVAVLRILALGIKNIQDFDFVDAPSKQSIDMAIRNLVQLGAITRKDDGYELTEEGRYLVKLGVEPRLGKLIRRCCDYHLGREGVVLAAVMANASSIFCRIGADDEKLKSDRLKVRFCHPDGDLFTLLSVFKEWEAIPRERRNRWCVENSINAKSMRRCQDTVKEFEDCLAKDLNIRIPTNWRWDPSASNLLDHYLKDIILSCLCENVAMYTGYDKLGYEVALTGQHVLLHPSCSLLAFGEKRQWVVFGEILSTSHPYLVCVTAFDFSSLLTLRPPPLFDVSGMKNRKMEVKVITGFGSMLLKKFCGKFNSNLLSLVSQVQAECNDDRIGIQVDVNQNEVSIFAALKDIGKVYDLVHSNLECEKRLLSNECMERSLYYGPGAGAPVALFGAGAVIKHLELKRRYLAVNIIHPNLNAIDDKELLLLLEKKTQSSICSVHKFVAGGYGNEDSNRWGRVTFLTPDAARQATELSEVEIGGATLKVLPSRSAFGGDSKFSFPGLKAKVYWPRRRSRGFGILKCNKCDMETLIRDFSNVIIGDKFIRCEASRKDMDSLLISGLSKDLTEAEILDVLSHATNRKIHDFFLLRGDPVESPAVSMLEEVLLREITPFMSQNDPRTCHCRVQIFPSEPKDVFVKAFITFDGRLHLEAAKALEHIGGKVLPGCQPWQKIRCEQLFHSSLTCSAPVYSVIKDELNLILGRFKYRKGVEYTVENFNSSHRVKISATATRIVAELRRPVEELMRGKIIDNASLSPAVFQQLFSRDGMTLMKSLQRETGTYIFFDRHNMNVRVFGSSGQVAVAEKKLVDSLIELHESKQLEIQLRRRDLPSDMMKEVVRIFGPDLQGLKEKIPRADFSLNTRRHVISVKGNRDMKHQVEEIVYDIAKKRGVSERLDEETEAACPICLCEVEDAYQLEACAHRCCRSCLLEQCDSAIKNQDSFPICCAYEGCGSPILVADLRSLLSLEKVDELFRASIGAFVASSGGRYRFCPSPDCPSVYQVADEGTHGEQLLVCGACYAETCTRCHMEYHPYLTCEEYREFKKDPDKSLFEWCKGKEDVKRCPVCAHVIEKIDGCNHIECRCGNHLCWVCLEVFPTSDFCYSHLRSIHMAIL